MDIELGWVLVIGILGNGGEEIDMAIDFESYPIRCHFYNNLLHLLGECQAFCAKRNIIRKTFGRGSNGKDETKKRDMKGELNKEVMQEK
jgi:hypothetical protein